MTEAVLEAENVTSVFMNRFGCVLLQNAPKKYKRGLPVLSFRMNQYGRFIPQILTIEHKMESPFLVLGFQVMEQI